jgi:glycosyltransferase involved in cell wall biosynthesis
MIVSKQEAGTSAVSPGPDRPWFVLSGVVDDQYLRLRSDSPIACTSTGKREKLYSALAAALGTDPVILSPPPRGIGPSGKLEPVVTRFAGFEQRFSRSCGIPKLRMLLDMIDYAVFVMRQVPKRSLVIIDNYELIYVLPLLARRMLRTRDVVVLEYEDGKHLIDKGIYRWMSGLAELLGKRLLAGAILAAPGLGRRLPPGIPSVCVPGIAERSDSSPAEVTCPKSNVGFLYSGSLDRERGLPLLLEYLRSELVDPRAEFHITGQGQYAPECRQVAGGSAGRVTFHGRLEAEKLAEVRSMCRYGINLQRGEDPISDVTYPSKTFDYFNGGLSLISTRAAGVPEVFRDSAIYLGTETAAGLAKAVDTACNVAFQPVELDHDLLEHHSFPPTVAALRRLMARIGVQTPDSTPSIAPQ